MGVDFSKPETKALYENEVRKRTESPFFMSREQAQMLVAVLMSDSPETDFECENCLGMPEAGCYCQAMGAIKPGGPIA